VGLTARGQPVIWAEDCFDGTSRKSSSSTQVTVQAYGTTTDIILLLGALILRVILIILFVINVETLLKYEKMYTHDVNNKLT